MTVTKRRGLMLIRAAIIAGRAVFRRPELLLRALKILRKSGLRTLLLQIADYQRAFAPHHAWPPSRREMIPNFFGVAPGIQLPVNGNLGGYLYLGEIGSRTLTERDLTPMAQNYFKSLVDAATYDDQTRKIAERYSSSQHQLGPSLIDVFCASAKGDYRDSLLRRWVEKTPRKRMDPVGFSIVTPFYRHLSYFADCAESVAELVRYSAEQNAHIDIQWIVANDDPEIAVERLLDLIPADIVGRCKILSDNVNKGIVFRLNQAVDCATHPWVLFLDCDDVIASTAVVTLLHYIKLFPETRYISSATIDLSDDGVEIRRRMRENNPERILEKGMIAGHLMAIRRDLFSEIGGFDCRFLGCQDYDFALRVMEQEPILRVPDHLYGYRHHRQSQSVGHFDRQAITSANVKRAALLRFLTRSDGRLCERPVHRELRLGLCIVRTVGSRLDVLCQAVDSVMLQTPEILCCVVVHGDAKTFNDVERHLFSEFGSSGLVVKHADNTSRKRGYPLNVGLTAAFEAEVDYICILDEDDIFYPNFSQTMVGTFNATGADLVYAASLRRIQDELEPGYNPLPFAALLTSNFIRTNSFAVTTKFLREKNIGFPEDMHYMEDYYFLLELLESGVRAHPVADVLSEFTTIGDGNKIGRKQPVEFSDCQRRIILKQEACWRFLPSSNAAIQFISFPFSRRPILDRFEREAMMQTERRFADLPNES